MHFIALIFACSEVLSAIFYKQFYFYLQFFSHMVSPANSTKVIIIDRKAIFFLFTLVMHFALLPFCIYLMFIDLWQPASMLLILSALESFAVKYKISGVTLQSSRGYTYPTIILKYVISTLTLFILLNLAL